MKKHRLTLVGCSGMAKARVCRFDARNAQQNIQYKETGT